MNTSSHSTPSLLHTTSPVLSSPASFSSLTSSLSASSSSSGSSTCTSPSKSSPISSPKLIYFYFPC